MKHNTCRGILSLLLLGGVLLASACDAPDEKAQLSLPKVVTYALPTDTVGPTNTTTPVPTDTPLPTPPPTIALDLTEVKRQVAEIKADTVKMRGLKILSEVPEHFVSQDEMRYNATLETVEEYTPEEAKRDARRLWLLMFIDDPSIDFRQLEIEFAGEMILGYYDHRKKEMFVRTDQATLSPASRQTMSHELVHSLQDQHFDLQKLLPDNIENDHNMALRALIEGDATISGILYSAWYMSDGDFYKSFDSGSDLAPPVPGRAPVYLREAWQFPYVYGSEFILTIAEPGEFRPINRAFADPPVSSEQIMHPEKYLETPRDNPLPVELPAMEGVLGEGWVMEETDTLGEFDLQIMLRENFIEQPEASEGWGGARYALYSRGEDAVVVMGSRWDTDRDASEFESALEGSFKLFGKYDTLWHDSLRVWGMKRSGDMVMFVSGNRLENVQKVIGAIP